MGTLSFGTLPDEIVRRIEPFFHKIIQPENNNVLSVALVGTVLTSDYIHNVSDINSVVVLKNMELGFLKILSAQGKAAKKNKIAAPLIMTKHYIDTSLDTFPIEFLNFSLLHQTIYGENCLSKLTIHPQDLRLQLEREMKSRLIGLRQSYLSSLGDKKVLGQELSHFLSSLIPLFRSFIFLKKAAPAIGYKEVISQFHDISGFDGSPFEQALEIRRQTHPAKLDIEMLFEKIYWASEKLSEYVDALEI